jgi:hypothetical protein
MLANQPHVPAINPRILTPLEKRSSARFLQNQHSAGVLFDDG